MDRFMNMFIPKTSMSPVKSVSDSGSPPKRKHDLSTGGDSSSHNNGTSGHGKYVNKRLKLGHDQKDQGEPKFTFDEVKAMIDSLLQTQQSKSTTVSSCTALKQVDFDEVAVPGHSVGACRFVIEKLVSITRRVRNLQEVLTDIRDNLNKRAYTEAIMRSTMHMQPPKKPPSAYLLYHKERYEQLRDQHSKASEIAKIVSEEWKGMDERKRLPYHKKHNEMMKRYQKDSMKFGLTKTMKPKRAKSAKSLYVLDKLAEVDEDLDKEDISRLKEQYGQEFDELDKESKAHWMGKYEEEQERYRREKNEYIAANPHLDHTVAERNRTTRNAVKPPEKPKSAVKFYLAKKMAQGLEGAEFNETKQRLKEKFSSLSDKKQIKYIKKAIRDKERYEAELEEFKQAHPEVPTPKLKANVSKDQWKLYASLIENRPTPPAPTAYLHFCGKVLSDSQGDEQVPTQRLHSASVAWSNLSEGEKMDVERDHIAMIKAYLEEIDAWLQKQDVKKRDQVWHDEPRCRPEYWRKRLARLERNLKKKETS